MGQAKQRGSLEIRIAQSQEQSKQNAINREIYEKAKRQEKHFAKIKLRQDRIEKYGEEKTVLIEAKEKSKRRESVQLLTALGMIVAQKFERDMDFSAARASMKLSSPFED